MPPENQGIFDLAKSLNGQPVVPVAAYSRLVSQDKADLRQRLALNVAEGTVSPGERADILRANDIRDVPQLARAAFASAVMARVSPAEGEWAVAALNGIGHFEHTADGGPARVITNREDFESAVELMKANHPDSTVVLAVREGGNSFVADTSNPHRPFANVIDVVPGEFRHGRDLAPLPTIERQPTATASLDHLREQFNGRYGIPERTYLKMMDLDVAEQPRELALEVAAGNITPRLREEFMLLNHIEDAPGLPDMVVASALINQLEPRNDEWVMAAIDNTGQIQVGADGQQALVRTSSDFVKASADLLQKQNPEMTVVAAFQSGDVAFVADLTNPQSPFVDLVDIVPPEHLEEWTHLVDSHQPSRELEQFMTSMNAASGMSLENTPQSRRQAMLTTMVIQKLDPEPGGFAVAAFNQGGQMFSKVNESTVIRVDSVELALKTATALKNDFPDADVLIAFELEGHRAVANPFDIARPIGSITDVRFGPAPATQEFGMEF